jgi:alanyl-tRNA synthetase
MLDKFELKESKMTENRYGIPYMSSQEIRKAFFDHYKSKDHQFVRSSPVFPKDDPTVLFVNSGMMQFKSVFLGDNPKGLKRVFNSQKVLRVSGKHNDLDEVGRDHYHHTFFEMLGHWSFGDYFKKEAIVWGWELMTKVYKLPKERLFASVHITDDEAAKIWEEDTDIDPKHIMRFDKDNFWEMGAVGPCGPSTELHFDLGDEASREATYSDKIEGVNGENHRYVELINFVFMQNERLPDGSLKDLEQKHVDTGGGFERICSVIQGTGSNYQTDIFIPLLEKISSLSNVPYQNDDSCTPHRVIADHTRAVAFAIADGITPGNEGRGYVIRRILRRASKFASELGLKEPTMYKLVPTLIENMGEAYPELKERQSYIEQVIKAEEARFLKTLDQGLDRLSKLIADTKKKKKSELSGEDVFTLFDTFGFPSDLTALIAEENSLSIDTKGYEECMNEQRERARKAQKFDDSMASDENWTIIDENKSTEFLGYTTLETTANVQRYMEKGDSIFIVLNKSPFYAESGGQVGDTGFLSNDNISLKVEDTIKVFDMTVHRCTLSNGLLEKSALTNLTVSVDKDSRESTARHHSATHLLHAALKKNLGEHVSQQGSYCGPSRLRFDFTHHEGLTKDQLVEIENVVNAQIQESNTISTQTMGFEEAKSSGAVALFGEKYGDEVRVLKMGDFSMELCGGTHAESTGQIGSFKIISESSIAAGVRRIEAVAAQAAVELSREESRVLANVASVLKTKADTVEQKVKELSSKLKASEKLVKELKQQQMNTVADTLVASSEDLSGINFIQSKLNSSLYDKNDLQVVLDSVSSKLKANSVCVLTHEDQGNTALLVAITKDLHGTIKAGDLVKAVAELHGGRGGGRPDKARAGIKGSGLEDKILKDAKSALQAKF